MQPKDTVGFEWDHANSRELAAHGIAEWEAEQVFWNGAVWPKNKKRGSGDRKVIGFTDGGRALTIIVLLQPRKRTLRFITGWDSTAGERTRFLRKMPSPEEGD